MTYLTVEEIQAIHRRVINASGGTEGLRDPGALDAAAAQPQMTFGGEDLYSGLAEKAAALGFSLVQNHPFLDGNKRVGHAAMETFLVLNDHELAGSVDEQERIILELA